MNLLEIFKNKKPSLAEGGNLAAGQPGWKGDPDAGAAQQINLQVTNRSVIVPILNDLLAGINAAYQAQYQQPLWHPKLLKSQKFLSGSSLHFFNVKGIPDKVFVEKKPKVGDIDTMVDKEKEADLENFLSSNINKTMGPGKLLGFQRGNEQFSSLWELQDPPIKIQIDLEYVKFDKDEPTDWSRFSHSSDWNDLQAGVKGVFHKFLIQSFAVLSKRDFILRKTTIRGKNRTYTDVPTSDSMFSFAVSSKEGGGLRAKYTPVLNPVTNEPEMQDGLPVMLPLPTTGYEKEIGKMFQSLFGVKLNPKAAEQLAEKFWSFTGLLDVMNKLLEPEEKSRVLGSFLNKTFGPGAQGLYKNDPERDSAEKMAAVELLMKNTGAKPPEGMDLGQMRQEYISSYKVTAEALDEADDINAAPKPSFARQGIPHLYNRLPDGRVSSTEMKDSAFVELCKEIADNGGTLDGFPVTLKVDGKGVRFGKDASGRAFFMTDKISEPLYRDNVGYFTNFAREKGQDETNVARAQGYDDILNSVVNSRFIETIPPDTIITAELLYNPMAEKTNDGLKFIKIAYDPKKLGKTMTIAPIFAKQFSTGETRPDQDKIISKLVSTSDSNIKIVSTKLEQKGINVSKIIDPVVKMDSRLVSGLSAKGTTPEKTQAKQIIDQTKQALSDAIISSPKLKGIDSLGPNNEGIVVNMPSGNMFKVTSSQMKGIMAKQNVERAMGSKKPRTAVVAIGNFAGHRGHEDLINYAINKAKELNGTPFVYVGAKVGADDPIDVDTKIQTLQKLFPGVAISPVENQAAAGGNITAGNHMKKIEYELVKKEPYYNNIIIAVGSDQADSMASWAANLQKRFAKFPPLSHVKISVQPLARGAAQGGSDWSTTALRNSLKNKPEDQAFQDWSRAYNVQKLGPQWIKHLMDIARKNMGLSKPEPQQAQPKPTPSMPGQEQPQPIAERLLNALVKTKLREEDNSIMSQDVKNILFPNAAKMSGPSSTTPKPQVKPVEPSKIKPSTSQPSSIGKEKPLAKVIQTGPGFLVAQTADGEIQKRQGNRNWRNNNPGNISSAGNYAKSKGAIGSDGVYAIFPTVEMGRKAKQDLLFSPNSKYYNLGIEAGMLRYAPPQHNPNIRQYIQSILQATGATPDTTIGSLNPQQQQTMMNIISKWEGFKPGKITIMQEPSSTEGMAGGLAGAAAGGYLTKSLGGATTGYKLGSAAQDMMTNRNAKEGMLPKSAFAGSDKNKLGPAAHLKGKMKRPARQGDFVGGESRQVRIGKHYESVMSNLINKILINEAVQNNKRKHLKR